MTQECMFCQIVEGTLPCHKVYEDEDVLAILDHRPVRPGHTLIIPKKHYRYITDCPEGLYLSLMKVAQKVSQKILKVAEPEPLNTALLVHGYIPHVHIHVFPQYDWDDITSKRMAYVKDGEVAFDASCLPKVEDEKQKVMAQKLYLR